MTITENNQFLEHTSYQLEILPIDKQAPLSPSEKPQFDILCDGCYTPIRGYKVFTFFVTFLTFLIFYSFQFKVSL